MQILCLVPARSGSKGIVHKNIKLFRGKPLLAWSVEQARRSKFQMRVIVSTDSEEYANIARDYGAEVPFIRPAEISSDLSTDFEFVDHALHWLKQNEQYVPDIVVQLRPTYPTRNIEILDDCINIFLNERNRYDSLRTVVPFPKSPFKMYTIDDGKLVPLFPEVNGIREPYNQCRQVLPQCYIHNGYIDIFNASIVKYGTISGNDIFPYIMEEDECHDIDSMEDWVTAEINM